MEKPICPRCGKPMRLKTIEMKTYKRWYAWFEHCDWKSPFSRRPTRERAIEAAAKGANRRLIQKPLTLEEVKKLPNGEPVYIERRCADEIRGLYADIYQWENYLTVYYCGCESGECLHFAKYGKNWRCWNYRPTDEQVDAAPWEG